MNLRGAATLAALLALPAAAQDGPAEMPERIVIPGGPPESAPRPEDRPSAQEEPGDPSDGLLPTSRKTKAPSPRPSTRCPSPRLGPTTRPPRMAQSPTRPP
jgi:hypothetical protein